MEDVPKTAQHRGHWIITAILIVIGYAVGLVIQLITKTQLSWGWAYMFLVFYFCAPIAFFVSRSYLSGINDEQTYRRKYRRALAVAIISELVLLGWQFFPR